ncbi:sigma-70 family RNA polymerase sigma factor [Kribbella capetownensis]|uniref:Sigma-70 family RNA polymerase sigma factor n=1 Tax=Kribbella capetownensis TaxID=1572659 RepID=A0A4R0JF61_9ACTN|nr:sigma-70 family RNA polymerase sigma factor [Kribbella capetownensis]TCC45069.1 sigma-70 family RNA polymerase sigma factor [Kribbella capetownensis]
MNLEEEFAQHRAELVAHCYRMLGSLHDAEDAVQETYLRAWRGHADFEGRSTVRTWLYRIATNVCLNLLQHSSRRVVPSALGAPGNDPEELHPYALEVTWLEPFPDLLLGADPATVVGDRESLRLAMVAAMQHLPPRQRAVLILREVLTWPAAEVATLLDTTTAAVNSSLQRARAELARLRPIEEDLSVPDEPLRRALLDQFATAMENKDLVALEALFTADARWEMPPIPTWFSGRNDVLRLLDSKLRPGPDRRILVETSANGQPAFALYIRGHDGRYHAHSIKVLTLTKAGIAAVLAFHQPALFPAFGLSIIR